MSKTWLLAVTFIVLSSGSAYADVIPQDVYACNNLSAGSPCDNGAGVCQDSTCSRLDYSKWDRDASSSPPSTSYSCRKCVPKGKDTGTGATTATATDSTTATASTSSTGVATTSSTGVATTSSTGVATTATTSAATSTATNGGTDPGVGGKEDDTKESSGCSVGGVRVIAPWLLAGIFAACVTLLRRRSRR